MAAGLHMEVPGHQRQLVPGVVSTTLSREKEQDMSTVSGRAERVNLSGVAAPGWVAFERLRDGLRVDFEAGESDPFVSGPCPVWCTGARDAEEGEAAHPVEVSHARRVHVSESVTVPVKLLRGARSVTGGVRLGHVAVSLRANAATARPNGLAWVDVDVVQAMGRDRHVTRVRAASLAPAEARQLAEVLLAAVRLADPDGEFEEAVR